MRPLACHSHRRIAAQAQSLGLLLGMSSWMLAPSAFSGADRYFIAHGWDLLAVRPADVARHLDQWAKIPLDGVCLVVRAPHPDGTELNSLTILTDPPWAPEWFTNELIALRSCAMGTLRKNFLIAYWSPQRRLDWTDDEAWARVATNHAVLAWLAREGRAAGIMIDPEDYHETHQFTRVPGDPPWPQVQTLARQRGRQLMTAMATAYPNITLLSFWLLSAYQPYLEEPHPPAAVAEEGHLGPAFINGLLEALPPGARLVDGDEFAYRYDAARDDFHRGAWRVRNPARTLVAPENQSTYAAQVLVGFGLYLDMYINPPDSPWYFGPLHGSRPHRLYANLSTALRVADKFVWIYGEQRDWIHWSVPGRETNRTWPQSLPGFNHVLSAAKNRPAWARALLAHPHSRNLLTNLLATGDCPPLETTADSAPDRDGPLPAGWWLWRPENRRAGVFATDPKRGRSSPGSLKASGVEEGCLGTSLPVRSHSRFIVEAFAYGARAQIQVAWKTDGQWNWSLPRTTLRFTKPDRDPWRRACDLVEVPEGADELVLLLEVRQLPEESTWFDDIGLYPVPPWEALPDF